MLPLSEDRTASLVAALHAGELEAALVALEADLGEVAHEVIARDPFLLAAPPGHPLARSAGPVKLEALHDVALLVLVEGHCLGDQALSACHRARSSAFGATSLPTLLQMVAGGAGVTLLPALAAPIENRHGELRLRRFRAPSPGRTLALVWRRGVAAEEGLRKIAEVMRRAVRAMARAS